MLTEHKERVHAKVRELSDLLSEMGMASEICIQASDDNGIVAYRGESNSGFWQSSTSRCEGWTTSIEDIDVRHHKNEWVPSGVRC